ncbi:MAG: glycoside hydrolase family 99-like domain-containing protein [Candidatus Schekmanbacteria bacterium]|nr:glycoside hydrolase family 99-like domain-containing protein [Candidatus Schekmanbacteria bacterium]
MSVARALVTVVALSGAVLLARLGAGAGAAAAPPAKTGAALSPSFAALGARPTLASTVNAGVFYYTWYAPIVHPGHWWQGYANNPKLGEYSSADPAIAELHNGILDMGDGPTKNILLIEWWGSDTPAGKWLEEGWLLAPSSQKLQFAVVYDVAVRMWEKFGTVPERGFDLANDTVRFTIIEDIVDAVDRFAKLPNYLHIGGEPVIYIYLAREMRGLVREVMPAVRRHTEARTGKVPYIIGDELQWSALGNPPAFMERAVAYDAVTCFSCYDKRVAAQAAGSAERYAGMLAEHLYPAVLEMVTQATTDRARPLAFVPSVFPQFDDHAIRVGNPRLHLVEYEKQFSRMLERAATFATPLWPESWGMVAVYSFNEWHEGTTIEETAAGTVTNTGHAQYGTSLLSSLQAYHASRR